MKHGNQKKIAVINDMSGFGRCSLTVALPIISACGIQCCPLPTSIFSNHTGYKNYFFDDYTDKMTEFSENWKKLGVEFDGIQTGFLGSMRQIEIVERFINDFRHKGTVVVVDPVMGDNGKRYSTYTDEMCTEIRKLIRYADIITPNLTEACILTDKKFRHNRWTKKELLDICRDLADLGAKNVVISGIEMGSFLGNAVYTEQGEMSIIRVKREGKLHAGTGDVFSAIIVAETVNGADIYKAVLKASRFVKECIIESEICDIPSQDGVCFEKLLHKLR